MNIQQIEETTGMARANIRFYEKEGLLSPRRKENGYRDYSQEDVLTLLRIRLLRDLGASLAQIQELMMGKRMLSEVVRECLSHAGEEQDRLLQVQRICQELTEKKLGFWELDEELCLRALKSEAGKGKKEDRLPDFHPVLRLVARGTDYMLYELLWIWFYTQVLGWYPPITGANLETGNSILVTVLTVAVPMLLMLLLEPICLNLFATTPGKALLGIHVRREDGEKLTVEQAAARTFHVMARGEAFCVPFLSSLINYRSYLYYQENGYLPWDQGVSYQYDEGDGPNQKLRQITKALVLYLGFAAACYVILLCRWLPDNRGSLTIAEYAENYNSYWTILQNLEYTMAGELNLFLSEEGDFVSRKSGLLSAEKETAAYVFDESGQALPEISYEISDDAVTAVVLVALYEGEQTVNIRKLSYLVNAAAYALAMAQEETSLWTILSEGEELLNSCLKISSQGIEDYSFTQSGVCISISYDYGDDQLSWERQGYLISLAEEDWLQITCRIELVKE